MLPPTLKAGAPALLVAAIVCWLSGQKMGFLFLLDASPFLLFWFLWNVVQLWRGRVQLPVFLLKTGAWALGISIVLVLHRHYADVARAEGDALLTRVQQFQAREGRYPRDMAELGVRQTPGGPFFDGRDGQPILFYRSTAMPFTTYDYDFAKRCWYEDMD